MRPRTAAVTAASLFAVVMVFQVAVALGAPLGAYTQGGGITGILPAQQRIAAVASALVVAGMAMAVLAAVGIGPMRTSSPRAKWAALLATTAYSGVAVAVNLATHSTAERALWAPISIVLLLCCVRVVHGTQRR